MYTSVTAFAGLGDGDFFTANAEENVAMSIYLLFNIVLGAYILGERAWSGLPGLRTDFGSTSLLSLPSPPPSVIKSPSQEP